MAKAYIGANNVAKLVKAMYMGVDGVARKVTKAYRGVDGVAKLVYSGEEGYLYGGTSTFVHTGSFESPGADYSLTTDAYTLTIEKYDETPLYVYFDDELVATSTTIGKHTINVDGGASTLISKGNTITVTIKSEGTYGIGEQEFYQFYEYVGDAKIGVDSTLSSYMTDVILSDNIIKILTFAFSDTRVSMDGSPLVGVSTITIPDSVISIERYAFYMSSLLTSVTIGKNVGTIGDRAFMSCYGLEEIYFKGEQPIFEADIVSDSTTTYYDRRNFDLGTSNHPVTATVYTTGWGSDSVFTYGEDYSLTIEKEDGSTTTYAARNEGVRGQYTTFIYETI